MAQLNSASDFGSEGWGFESLRGHKKGLEISRPFFTESTDPQVSKNKNPGELPYRDFTTIEPPTNSNQNQSTLS